MVPKQELSKDDTNGNAKVDGGHETSTLHQELQKLRKARNELGNARGGPAQGRTHHLLLQFKAVSLENMHTGDYIWNKQFVFRNRYLYNTCMQ